MERMGMKSLLVTCLTVQAVAHIIERGDISTNYEIYEVENERVSSLSTVPSLDGADSNDYTNSYPASECDLSPGMRAEIQGYQEVVDSIIDYVTTGEYKGQVYSELAELVDLYGPRTAGSGELEAAIDWMIQKSITEGLDNVRTEDVKVPHWVRNKESATMIRPRLKELPMMGLGSSVGTPPDGLTAEVLVVKSFDDLKVQGDKVAGKIVVFNPEWVSYGVTVQYRSQGASEAAKLGAVAALIRSVTPFSLASPHTGQQYYTFEKKIPAACITVEDAAMMERMQARGTPVEVKLLMGAETYPDVISRNTVVEIKGTTLPNETVLVSGHLDSWDVTEGAMDDGGGMMISWASLVVMKKLGLTPRRTVRAVFWTGEEPGIFGGYDYFNKHKDQHEQFQLIMESDMGTFNPRGISFSGTDEATCIMKEVVKLLYRINTTQVTTPAEGGPDIEPWQKVGVPTGGLNNDNDKYYWYHHSHGDTLNVEDPDALDRCLALWTSVAYVIADIKERLPRS